MKIVAIDDNGQQIELKELEVLPECDVIIVKPIYPINKQHADALEKDLTEKIGKKVVVLPYDLGEVLCIK